MDNPVNICICASVCVYIYTYIYIYQSTHIAEKAGQLNKKIFKLINKISFAFIIFISV